MSTPLLPTHDAIAGLCPDDHTAVTFHWDEAGEDGSGALTGVPGGIYRGTCNTCHRVLIREHGPIVTTIGGGPSPLEHALDAALARREARLPATSPDNAKVGDDLAAEIGKLSSIERDDLLASLRRHNAETDDEPGDGAGAPGQPAADVDQRQANVPGQVSDTAGIPPVDVREGARGRTDSAVPGPSVSEATAAGMVTGDNTTNLDTAGDGSARGVIEPPPGAAIDAQTAGEPGIGSA